MSQYPKPDNPIGTHAGVTRQRSPALLIGVVVGVLVLIGAAVLVIMMMSGKQDSPAATQPAAETKPTPVIPKGPAIAVDATEMLNLFRDDPAAADILYKAKILDVTGVVSAKLDSNFAGERAIALEGGVQRFAGVRCVLPEANHFQLGEVEQGQTVTIRGRCEGLVSDVILRDSAVLPKGSGG